jgi:outer membrane immunogenic protein
LQDWGRVLKKFLLTGASLGTFVVAVGAQAADLGQPPVYKAPPMPAPAWSWTGFYVGGTIGAVSDRSTVTNDPSGLRWIQGQPSNSSVGVIGGLEAGYNWQISQVVLGLEGDISWSSLNHTVNAPAAALVPQAGIVDTFSSRLESLGTIRGRVGWAFDRTLIFATGGVAFADLKDQVNNFTAASPSPFTAATSSFVTGWTAGGGIEYAFSDHWTAKAEYLHVGLPGRTASLVNTGQTYAFDFKDRLDIGRVGINYKF